MDIRLGFRSPSGLKAKLWRKQQTTTNREIQALLPPGRQRPRRLELDAAIARNPSLHSRRSGAMAAAMMLMLMMMMMIRKQILRAWLLQARQSIQQLESRRSA
jgi:hypothetical protein